MRFSKKDDIYTVIRITGSQDNILGISFIETNSSEANIEVIEWDYPNIDRRKDKTSKEEVLKQVISGLAFVNKALGTNYKLSKIYFSPFDSANDGVYVGLISTLIKHFHNGDEFKEVE
jgi:hypothetical protein